jgi:predicted dehydrogenase
VLGGEELLREVDVLVVASEPDLRFHHTALALEHGLDVLLEQPVAPTVENARMLDRIASLRPLTPVVQVSQPDRFHPALGRLSELLAEEPALAIEFRRRGPQPAGMLQDIHTLVGLARSPLVRLQASGDARYSVATLVFENGLVGTLSAGEVGHGPVHEVVATTADSTIAVDALAGTIESSRGGVCERVQVPLGDPLLAQAKTFLAAVRHRARPEVTLRTASACLEVAESVRECLAVQAAATGAMSPQAPPAAAD